MKEGNIIINNLLKKFMTYLRYKILDIECALTIWESCCRFMNP